MAAFRSFFRWRTVLSEMSPKTLAASAAPAIQRTVAVAAPLVSGPPITATWVVNTSVSPVPRR